jgi:hypothetical protein
MRRMQARKLQNGYYIEVNMFAERKNAVLSGTIYLLLKKQ